MTSRVAGGTPLPFLLAAACLSAGRPARADDEM
jgi:hypothetical protein